jgi:hypothetical protein
MSLKFFLSVLSVLSGIEKKFLFSESVENCLQLITTCGVGVGVWCTGVFVWNPT